ncbi:hypothetical protein SynMEDNS5_02111 [Synechococcus sp. MEDNS5]|uniref:hypothetical protein n=1 Tax=Synechococcus sp. MEDNS5 TaxID=1442554 RepID=UPI0016471ED2|nr:hypothetical protein [Synechococcus sp. MEDNS5]QNJ06815.1 hypothetical protein SynMEDNS5_02111 [Synechococcus sp. MEDNS5]
MNFFSLPFLIQWLFTWLILNWGASLALGSDGEANTGLGQPRRRRPLASQQPKFIIHALLIEFAIDWFWMSMPDSLWN